MKSFKLKVWVALVTAICGISGLAGSAFAQTGSTAATVPAVKCQQEKTAINNDLSAVKFQQDRIANLENKYHADKAAGREEAALNDKKEMIRAKGELKMYRAYLKADKMMLIENYNLAISSHKDALKSAKSKLEASKNKLDKDIANGKEDVVDKDALAVVQNQKEVKRREAVLHNERANKNSDILAMNRNIRKANGEVVSSSTSYAEDVISNTTYWLEK